MNENEAELQAIESRASAATAQARADIPWLVAEIRRLQGQALECPTCGAPNPPIRCESCEAREE